MSCWLDPNLQTTLSSRRLLTLIAGWSADETFVTGHYFFWIPLILPHVGGLIGAAIYVGLVEGIHHDHDEKGKDLEHSDSTKEVGNGH